MDLVPLRLLFVPIYCAIAYWMVGMFTCSQYTVEPLSKDTLNKVQALWSLQDHGNTILPLKKDNLSITVKLTGPESVHYSEVSLYIHVSTYSSGFCCVHL